MRRRLFLFACAIAVCCGCGSDPDPNNQRAIEVAREWYVAQGYNPNDVAFRPSFDPDSGEWLILIESNPAPAGGHTWLLLDKDFAVRTQILGR
jgi:hypothetical protein